MSSSHWPKQFPQPSAALLKDLGNQLEQLAADSLMIWVCPTDSDHLIAAHNPTLPKLCGFQQSLDRGTISQVFLTGLPILEKDLKQRADHDPGLDQLHQQSTRAMIAAPITSADEIVGVLSAVQFADSEQTNEFNIEHLLTLTSLALALTAGATPQTP